MLNKTLHRRTLLRGSGVAIALPFLEAMLPSRLARGAVAERPLRAAFLYVPNGKHMPFWKPDHEGKDFDLKPTLEPLAKHRQRFSILTNLTLDGAFAHGDGAGDHARSSAAFLTGAHPRKTEGSDIYNGISIDQVIAGHLSGKSRFSSLELGIEGSSQAGGCDSGYSCAYSSNLAWRSPTSPLAKEMDPAAVFDRLFSSGESKADQKTSALRKNRRKSVLDFALSDAKRLHGQLGAADQRKLDEYLYAIRDVETTLVQSAKLQVGENGIPNFPRPAGVPRELDEHCRVMLDLMSLAFRTDSTRVITFMFANEGNNWGYPQLGAPEGHHDLSHHGNSVDKHTKLAKINRFHTEMLAYFLDSLASIQEAEGSILDNSLIVYGSGISDGDRHNHDDLPILLAGGGAGRLTESKHLIFPEKTPMCNLYLWMMKQFKVPGDSFGDSTARLDLS